MKLTGSEKRKTSPVKKKNTDLSVPIELIASAGQAVKASLALAATAAQAMKIKNLEVELDFARRDIQAVIRLQEKAYEELQTANKELVFQNGEKEKRAVELSIANNELAFQNNEKEKRAVELGIANTELAFQNDEKEKRAVELSIANKDLTSFTYISSHDLQEPLRKIRIFADCLMNDEEKNLSAKGKNQLKKIMDTAGRMQGLINALLAYSQTKNNERVFEVTDLTLMLDHLKAEFEEILHHNTGTIETDMLCKAKVVPFQFQQLLHNLLSNSIKFSNPGVPLHIIVKSKLVQGDHLHHKDLLPSKSYCHITVSDNGIGFEPQYKNNIFEVFKRLHSADEFPGTGIGLAICKRIVENHHGAITATGEPGKGARFDIYIPAE